MLGRLVLLGGCIAFCFVVQAQDRLPVAEGGGAGQQFDGSFTINAPSRPAELLIEAGKIGLLAAHGVTQGQVREIAKKSGLDFDKPIGEGLYVLTAVEPLSQGERWALSRRLETDFPNQVRAAGLVARRSGTADRVVIDDTIYIRFEPQVDDSQVAAALDKYPVLKAARTRYGLNEFKLLLDPKPPYDPLSISKSMASLDGVIYAHPDIAQRLKIRSLPVGCDELTAEQWEEQSVEQSQDRDSWCDGGFYLQWPLENKGEWALEDADAKLRAAWSAFTQGDHRTLIAVIDFGFHAEHWDLQPNLWQSENENGDRGIVVIASEPAATLLDSPGSGSFSHGTKAAGVAAARGGNTYHGGGIAGACPKCKLLLIRVPEGELTGDMKEAFKLAEENGADVISMSLGFPIVTENIAFDIEEYTTQAIAEIGRVVNTGVVIVFAMDNEPVDHCVDSSDSSTLESVIAVGGITDYDQRSPTGLWQALGFGDCMDVVAPTGGGSRQVWTTSVKWDESLQQPKTDFRWDFHGTSAATPLVAGVVALMHNVLLEPPETPQAPGPTAQPPDPAGSGRPWPLQVQMILQDTADKVEPCEGQVTPCQSQYDSESGFSRPAESTSTHGYGRINAFEAVRLVAPVEKGGRGNRDLLLRDHAMDWGNTEQPSDTVFSNPRRKVEQIQSVDIKIDAHPFQPIGPTDHQSFLGFQSEKPVSGASSRVHVRVRNRGQNMVDNSTLHLYWAAYEDELPVLPEHFWAEFRGISTETSHWHPLASQIVEELVYSGASAAGCPQRSIPVCLGEPGALVDQAQVLEFDVEPITWDTDNKRLAWLAVLHSNDDPVQALSGAVPEGFDRLSVMSNVLLDNNITLFTAAGQSQDECPSCLLWLLIVLGMLAVALLAYIIYLLLNSPHPVPVWLATLFAVVLLLVAIVAYFYYTTPGCT